MKALLEGGVKALLEGGVKALLEGGVRARRVKALLEGVPLPTLKIFFFDKTPWKFQRGIG